jgi:hypothetical protein
MNLSLLNNFILIMKKNLFLKTFLTILISFLIIGSSFFTLAKAQSQIDEICQEDSDCLDGLMCNKTKQKCEILPFECNKDDIDKLRCDDKNLEKCVKKKIPPKTPPLLCPITSGLACRSKTVYNWEKVEECPDSCLERQNLSDKAECGVNNDSNQTIAKLKKLSYIFIQKKQTSPFGFLYPKTDISPNFDSEQRHYLITLDEKYYDFNLGAIPDGQLRIQNGNQNDKLNVDYELSDEWQEGDLNNDQIVDKYRLLKVIISGQDYQDGIYLFDFVVLGQN